MSTTPTLEQLADDYYEYRQATDLHRLLYLGSLDHLERWEDVTPDAIAERQATLRDAADRADRLADDVADDPVRSALADTLAFTARSSADQLVWRTEQAMVNPAFGLHTTLLTFLGGFNLATADHGAAYHEKLRRLPALLADIAEVAGDAADEGRVALARHLTATSESIERYLTGPSGPDDPLCRQSPPSELRDSDAARWVEGVRDIVEHDIRPALCTYADALGALAQRGRSDDQAGHCWLDGGDDVYASLLRSHSSLDLTAAEIHEIGLNQIEVLEEEYRNVAGPLFETDDVAAIYARLRDDESMRYRSGDAIVRDATTALEKATAAAPAWFNRLPVAGCSATETDSGPLAFYSTPDPASGKPGRFFFNTADPSAWATYQLEAITYHESIPGHHLQLALHAESTDLHPVQRTLPITAYLEGWGLYTERLADEMGLYSSEIDRLGMLAADSMRACRLVVDTGMHALRWSRARAIDYMVDHSPLSRGLVEAEIDRYIGMPGQAVSYMLGRLEIDRIRADAQRRPDFDIAAFHDAVLGYGMVPLGTLARLV